MIWRAISPKSSFASVEHALAIFAHSLSTNDNISFVVNIGIHTWYAILSLCVGALPLRDHPQILASVTSKRICSFLL